MTIPLFGYVSQGTLALFIPIIAIIGAFSSAMFAVYHKASKQREMMRLYHAERMAAIEKGIELPPLRAEFPHDVAQISPTRRRYKGVMTLLVGVAITLALWKTGGNNAFWWGLIIVAVGLGQLVINYLERRDQSVNSAGAAPPGGGAGNSTYPGGTGA